MTKVEWVCTAIVNEKTGISYKQIGMFGYIPDGTRFYMENINTGDTYVCRKIIRSYLDIMGYHHKSRTLYRISSDELKLLRLLKYKRIYGHFNISMMSFEYSDLVINSDEAEIKKGFAFMKNKPVYTIWDYILNVALKDKRLYKLTDNTLSIAVTNEGAFKWVEYDIKSKASLVKFIMMR